MIAAPIGRPLAGAALSLCLSAAAPVDAGIEVVADSGAVLATFAAPEGAEWCLHWRHSVTGGAVADCFETRAGTLLLTRSFLHDYAAGLGEIAGRGTVRAAAGGGYWIDAIDEPLPGNTLRLRVGGARVAHRIAHPGGTLALSARAAGQRVTLRPTPR